MIQLTLGCQAMKSGRDLNGIEVFALEVLDEGKFQLLPFLDIADERRNLLEAGGGGGTPAPLTGDDAKGVIADTANGDGLDNAVGADGGREFGELFVIEAIAGLRGIGLDAVEGDVLEFFFGG